MTQWRRHPHYFLRERSEQVNPVTRRAFTLIAREDECIRPLARGSVGVVTGISTPHTIPPCSPRTCRNERQFLKGKQPAFDDRGTFGSFPRERRDFRELVQCCLYGGAAQAGSRSKYPNLRRSRASRRCPHGQQRRLQGYRSQAPYLTLRHPVRGRKSRTRTSHPVRPKFDCTSSIINTMSCCRGRTVATPEDTPFGGWYEPPPPRYGSVMSIPIFAAELVEKGVQFFLIRRPKPNGSSRIVTSRHSAIGNEMNRTRGSRSASVFGPGNGVRETLFAVEPESRREDYRSCAVTRE